MRDTAFLVTSDGLKWLIKNTYDGERALHFHCRGHRLDPWSGN